jgi:hypothetical protein
MKLKIIFLSLLLSASNFIAMTLTRIQDDVLEVNGIQRVFDLDLQSFIYNLRYNVSDSKKMQLLLFSKDFMDAQHVAQAIAAKHDMIFVYIDVPLKVCRGGEAPYSDIFHKAKMQAQQLSKSVLVFLHLADDLISDDWMTYPEACYHNIALARVLKKYKKDNDIKVIVHCRNKGNLESSFRNYFGFKSEIHPPDRASQKLIIQKRFDENNVRIKDKMLNYLLNYLKNKSWSETDHIAQALVETAKECKTNTINSSIIRMYLRDFRTPLEKIQDCLNCALKTMQETLKNKYFWGGSGVIALYVFIPTIVKKIKAKNSRRFRKVQ